MSKTKIEVHSSEEALALLTPETFRAWLASKPVDAPVGYEHLYCECPISEFFKDRGIEVQVGNWFDMSTFNVIGMAPVELPEWLVFLAGMIDEGECSQTFPISAAEAIERNKISCDTEDCDENDPLAVSENGQWYKYVLYRPVVGLVMMEIPESLSAA